jgi:hypothetical protein
MLLLGSSFGKIPILSLRISSPVGAVIGHLINPHTLRVDALWCRMHNSKTPKLLVAGDIREISPKGIIVNDHEDVTSPDEVVRLKKIIDLHYDLIDKKVISGRLSIGKVVDYAVDPMNLSIQKLYVEPSLLGRLRYTRLTVDRSQVIEVSQTYVKIKSATVAAKKETSRIRLPQSMMSSIPASATTALMSE